MPDGFVEIDPAAAGHALLKGLSGRAAAGSSQVVESAATGAVPQGQNRNSASLADICGQLMALQRDRIFAIRMQRRCDNATLAYVRTRLGFTTDRSEAERKRIAAEAKRLVKAVESGATGQPGTADEAADQVLADALSAVIIRNIAARAPWDEMRKMTEQTMRSLARSLPAWPFAKAVSGFSDLGLAVVVGEAGDLGGYPKKGHLWKRLGLAVIDGRRQGAPGDKATADDWTRHGYNKSRRAEVYAFVDDVMFRHQWRGAKDDQPGYPIGRYGQYYATKKLEYLIRFDGQPGCKAHADAAARRYMSKMLLRDLWVAWRGAAVRLPQGQTPIAPCQAPDVAGTA